MPRDKKLKGNDLAELIELAKNRIAEEAQAGIEGTDWNDVRLYSNMRLSDFVEKRFMGTNETNINIEHMINLIPRRLEHLPDSPRKKAAEIVLEKYRECFDRVTDLNFQQQTYDMARDLIFAGQYAVDAEKRREMLRINHDNMIEFRNAMEKLRTYQNFMNSFFSHHAVRKVEEGQVQDPFEREAERQILEEIAAALPEGEEYDLYRTRAGYENQESMVLNPQSASLVMNPNVITDITVDNFPEEIRKENPSPLTLEWGAGTFDNMMEGLYNHDEWDSLKHDNRRLLNMVYLNGRPAAEQLPARRHGEEAADYERRLKCEIVAFALEGRGKIDIAPLRKNGDVYEAGDPVPVQVKVNLEEKVPAWKRFLRYFHIAKLELKKEKAERISLEDLDREERTENIRRDTQRIIARENTSQMVREVMQQTAADTAQADLDFFGHLSARPLPENPARRKEALNLAVLDRVNTPISPEIAKQLGMEGFTTVNLTKTLDRFSSRVSMVRLFALSKGMSMEDVLSSDPALRERKEALGKEFLDIITLKKPEEFFKENGADADYKAYFDEKARGVYDMLKNAHECLGSLPFTPFKSAEPQDLMANFNQWSFLCAASQDILQCCPDHVRNLNPEELKDLETRNRSIGALRKVETYCTNYIASDSYARINLHEPEAGTVLINAIDAKAAAEALVNDTRNLSRMGELSSVLNEEWTLKRADLQVKLAFFVNDAERIHDMAEYMEKDGRPLHYFDDRTGTYTVDSPDNIENLRIAREAEAARAQAAPTDAAPRREAVSLKDLEPDVKKPFHPEKRPAAPQKDLQKTKEHNREL